MVLWSIKPMLIMVLEMEVSREKNLYPAKIVFVEFFR